MTNKTVDTRKRADFLRSLLVYSDEWKEALLGAPLNTPIADLINDVASAAVSSMNSGPLGMWDWFQNTDRKDEYMTRVISEGRISLNSKEYFFSDHVAAAQLLAITNEVDRELFDAHQWYLYEYLANNGFPEISEACAAEIDKIRFKSINTIEELQNAVLKIADKHDSIKRALLPLDSIFWDSVYSLAEAS